MPKSKKRAGSKKRQKQASNGKDEESNTQSTSSYSSEDDNASLESNGGLTSDTKPSAAVNLNGKTRASRGSATDPQSLYARVITQAQLALPQDVYVVRFFSFFPTPTPLSLFIFFYFFGFIVN